MHKIFRHIKKHKYGWAALLVFAIWFYNALPDPLFQPNYSTVLLSQNNELLGAQIAPDGQWRFAPSDSIPKKFKQCLVQFEDAYFYRHPGVNPISLAKAVYQDVKAQKIVRGGSTISMQVIRMAKDNPPRTIPQKLLEMLLALRLELSYNKDQILNLYAAHAPFGGNVVGLEAAAWRYYGRSPEKLSWGETATLAVLPNAPALIYPGKNHQKLRQKRNRLLDKLQQAKIIDSITCKLAKEEELPGKPKPLPQIAPHLINQIPQAKRFQSAIQLPLQQQINNIVKRQQTYLAANKIYNMGIMVIDIDKNKVIAYVGNTKHPEPDKGGKVDMIQARRSTGSILKPFLYAWAMKDALILPQSLLKDIPTQIAGYHPKNYNKTYDGMVPADQALARSLNIPAVRLLRQYGLQKFHDNLQQLHIPSINKPAGHYGLTLILGGAEISLWEASRIYSGMARSLNVYNQTGKYYQNTFQKPSLLARQTWEPQQETHPVFGADNIWFVFKALSDKDRPVEGDDWSIYRSAQKIAWKTGTSFGHRDAWCIGATPKYVVGVWVGNASGEGRPGLTGTQVAAPVMFEVFKHLPSGDWFQKPENSMRQEKICSKSGYLATENCEESILTAIPLHGERSLPCPYHKIVHLNKQGDKQVNSSCYPVADMQTKKWFVLPPIPAWYYKKRHPDYQSLPPWSPNCQAVSEKAMALIYPKPHAQIFLPKDFGNVQQKTVFKAVHRQKDAVIYWHLDEDFIGKTFKKHQLEIYTTPGAHTLTLVDNQGETIRRNFTVIQK